jgi:hypothetical protein
MYENAQWIDDGGKHFCIRVDINGLASWVPIDPANTDYANIMALVAEGKLVIQPAEGDQA